MKSVIKDVPIRNAVRGRRFSDLSVVAYYPKYWDIRPDPTDEAFWSGDMLRAMIPLLGDVTFVETDSGTFEEGRGQFEPLDKTDFDIGWEVCANPTRKIAKWVFGVVSDFVGRERAMETWLRGGRLDAVFTLRCVSQRLQDACRRCGLPLYSFPYFVVNRQEYLEDKPIDAALIGTRGAGYNWRQKMFPVLRDLSSRYRVLIHDASSKATRIPYAEYVQILRRVKYFFSGGVDDGDWDTAQIPAKQIEACGAGACLVSPDLPMNRACGFVDDETYVMLRDVSEIPDVLASDRWKRVSRAGQDLVNERHTVEVRAKTILEKHERAI